MRTKGWLRMIKLLEPHLEPDSWVDLLVLGQRAPPCRLAAALAVLLLCWRQRGAREVQLAGCRGNSSVLVAGIAIIEAAAQEAQGGCGRGCNLVVIVVQQDPPDL